MAETPESNSVRDPVASLDAFFCDAESALVEQRRLALELSARRSARRWFAHFAALRFEEQLAACRAGRLGHTDWALQLIVRELSSFQHAARAELAHEKVSEPWQSAFAECERAAKTPMGSILALLPCLLVEARHVHPIAALEAARAVSAVPATLRDDGGTLAACASTALGSFAAALPGSLGVVGRALGRMKSDKRTAILDLVIKPYARSRSAAFERAISRQGAA